MSSIGELEPRAVWRYFQALAAIPRPSEREEGVRAFLIETARQKGWQSQTDGAGNVLLRVPASEGRDKAPIVVLQAHMDMVTIKAPGSSHDFDKDPIRLVLGEHYGESIVHADGTTLGADNGMGLCAALALADSPDLPHGPLEILATVNEESGMSGAHGLDASMVHGRTLLNLDSEEDDALYVGCVGGASGWLDWTRALQPVPADWLTLEIVVDGLRGGHSGLEIHESRGNAILVLARLLQRLPTGEWRLASCSGGSRTNAIPRDARCTVAVSPALESIAGSLAQAIRDEVRVLLGPHGSGLEIEVLRADVPASEAWNSADSDAFADATAMLPHGVLAHDEHDPRILETSCNVALLRETRENGRFGVEAEISIRSLRQEKLAEVVAHLEREAKRTGAGFRGKFRYPPWQPDHDSPLLQTARTVYEQLFGAAPRVATIHGGLETGIIGDKIPGIRMISFGPRIEEPHTPEERVFVRSVAKFWKMLITMADKLSQP
ncbi:MAG: dipeptidase [Candidatus Sumerlaeota bacterium]|nr:dipeptidase [Candidatus Sumerlaeota bacterium]